jgi:hypothetical protein
MHLSDVNKIEIQISQNVKIRKLYGEILMKNNILFENQQKYSQWEEKYARSNEEKQNLIAKEHKMGTLFRSQSLSLDRKCKKKQELTNSMKWKQENIIKISSRRREIIRIINETRQERDFTIENEIPKLKDAVKSWEV